MRKGPSLYARMKLRYIKLILRGVKLYEENKYIIIDLVIRKKDTITIISYLDLFLLVMLLPTFLIIT